MRKTFHLLVTTALLATVLVSCSKDDVAVTGVKLNNTSLTLLVGETHTLTATILPESATNKTVVWTSSNPLVASVMPNGLVTALYEGTTTIVATTQEGISATCVVKVKKTISQVRFKKESGGDMVVNMRLNYPNSTTVVEHRFGTGNGESNYFEIPPGIYIPMAYQFSTSSGWYNCFNNPNTRDFRAGYKYTIVYKNTGFHFVQDGKID